MLAVVLGRAAVDGGRRVYFTTAAELAAQCHKAALEGRWKTCMWFFDGPKLFWSPTSWGICRCPRTGPPHCSR
ncbi:hypothetical protein [Streptomyces sp. NPDC007205]|uniref:hypothetical protein n=1 Tax=Streptomyces sp. NPDC007205 TaxID=3154316 RepID=UPI0033F47EFE